MADRDSPRPCTRRDDYGAIIRRFDLRHRTALHNPDPARFASAAERAQQIAWIDESVFGVEEAVLSPFHADTSRGLKRGAALGLAPVELETPADLKIDLLPRLRPQFFDERRI